MTYRISFESNPRVEDVEVLKKGIAEGVIEPYAFFIRGDNNQILGGCYGEIRCGCLHIRHLWVDESIRGRGYGGKLMLSAENLGAEKSCTFASATTMAIDVVNFYKTLGYAIEFERAGYHNNATLYYMRRDFLGK